MPHHIIFHVIPHWMDVTDEKLVIITPDKAKAFLSSERANQIEELAERYDLGPDSHYPLFGHLRQLAASENIKYALEAIGSFLISTLDDMWHDEHTYSWQERHLISQLYTEIYNDLDNIGTLVPDLSQAPGNKPLILNNFSRT